MQTARRLYLYLMSGVTLGIVLVGMNMLITVALHAAGLGRGDFAGGTADDRQQLSLAIALVGVLWPAAPVSATGRPAAPYRP